MAPSRVFEIALNEKLLLSYFAKYNFDAMVLLLFESVLICPWGQIAKLSTYDIPSVTLFDAQRLRQLLRSVGIRTTHPILADHLIILIAGVEQLATHVTLDSL
jgi:hypothetical protein